MPAKNRIKSYEPRAYYHLYNRGVEKREVFLDAQDFAVWRSYLGTYLLPKNTKELMAILSSDTATTREKDKALKLLRLNNFADILKLHAYCLMPNHFHMLVRQSEPENIDQFMNSLGTRYAMYFNKKYKRVGPLFQGVYKAVRVTSDEQLLYLTKYIHRNPYQEGLRASMGAYPHSSYLSYIGKIQEKWVDATTIPSIFSLNPARYQAFVEEHVDGEKMSVILKDFTID